MVGEIEAMTFLPDSTRLWYRKTVKGGHEFVLVDAVARTKGPAFDHARLATSINAAANTTFAPETLPLAGLRFINDPRAIDFALPDGAPRQPSGNRAGPGVRSRTAETP